MVRDQHPIPSVDFAEAARMVRAVAAGVPALTTAERAVARHALAAAVVLDAACLDWSTSETAA